MIKDKSIISLTNILFILKLGYNIHMTSLEPNKERIKQRREEVIRAALRSKKYTTAQLTQEASAFIKFCLSLEGIRLEKEKTNGEN